MKMYKNLEIVCYVTNQIGPGWRHVLTDMLEQLDSLGCRLCITDIQKKFGALRVSYAVLDQCHLAQNAKLIVEKAERLAAATCWHCAAGSEGIFYSQSADEYYALCAQHRAKN